MQITPALIGSVFLAASVVLPGCLTGPHTALNDAIVAGDMARVKNALEGGAPPDKLGSCKIEPANDTHSYLGAGSGGNPLVCAIGNGRLEAVRLLIEHGANVEARDEWGWSPLTFAAYFRQMDMAKLLIANGADVDAAISRLESAAQQAPITRAKCLAAVQLLKELKASGIRACTIRYRADTAMAASFPDTAAKYRALLAKPELPEEARAFRVQAESALSDKRFRDAVVLYGKALAIAPWWPEGHFNQALILGEGGCPEEAIAAMERYLALVPDAPDARAARDRIYQWKGWIP